MPRPKRAKAASSTTRVAKPLKHADPPVPQKQPKSRTSAATKPVTEFSDDSDGLVVKSMHVQRRLIGQPEQQEEAEYTMTGALPMASEEEGSRNSRNRTPLSHASRRTGMSKNSAQGSSSRKSPRVTIPAKLQPTQKDAGDATAGDESSGFGDHFLSFTSLDSESPAHGTRPPSAIKVGATPAHERSILALTNFKRRARQPSLLRMVHQTTDVEDNDIDDSGDLEDFLPEAESTPLPKQQSAPGNVTANDSGVNLSSSSSRGTKRKLSPVIHVPRSSPPYDPPSGPDLEESRSSSPSLPDVVRGSMEHESQQEDRDPAEPEVFSETMAPPLSSSEYPLDEIEDPPKSPVSPQQRRRRGIVGKSDDEDSEGEATDRPKRVKQKQKPNPNKGISTAKLRALLPKRRTRLTHEDSDSARPLDSDQDELAMPPRRHAPAARKPIAPKATKKSARVTKKSTVAAKTVPKGSRTYGRRRSSDKENEGREEADEDSEEEHDTIPIASDKPSAHLEAMAKKFEDIDAFDLDFESVSYVQTSSSPWR